MYIFYRASALFLFAPCNFKADRDVREIEQQRVCPANSTLNSVHGRTLFNRLFPLFIGGGGACAEGMFLPRIFVAEKGFAPVSFTQLS